MSRQAARSISAASGCSSPASAAPATSRSAAGRLMLYDATADVAFGGTLSTSTGHFVVDIAAARLPLERYPHLQRSVPDRRRAVLSTRRAPRSHHDGRNRHHLRRRQRRRRSPSAGRLRCRRRRRDAGDGAGDRTESGALATEDVDPHARAGHGRGAVHGRGQRQACKGRRWSSRSPGSRRPRIRR